MDGEELVSAVREAKATELDRLGSEKALVAETDADLSPGSVLAAAARAEARATDTFAAWAADEPDEHAREAFAEVAARERDHHERVVAAMDGDLADTDAPAPDAVHEHLRGLDATTARVGAGLVGRPLVASRTLLQVVSFFVNEADDATADRFREIRAETDALVDEGAAVLDAVCGTGDDWTRASEAAEDVIAVAYREYADTLEGMGLDPKPVC